MTAAERHPGYGQPPEHPVAAIRARVLRWSNNCVEAEHMGQSAGPCPLDQAEVLMLLDALDRARAECAALADALDEDRHEFDGLDMEVVDRAGATRTATVCVSAAAESRCRRTADHRVHRTPAVVRAEARDRVAAVTHDSWDMAEWEVLPGVCLIAGCNSSDIDERDPGWLRDGSVHKACVKHWEGIFEALGDQQATSEHGE